MKVANDPGESVRSTLGGPLNELIGSIALEWAVQNLYILDIVGLPLRGVKDAFSGQKDFLRGKQNRKQIFVLAASNPPSGTRNLRRFSSVYSILPPLLSRGVPSINSCNAAAVDEVASAANFEVVVCSC